MTFSMVPTVAAGDMMTAANFNAYFRDNFAACAPAIFTTKGDLLVGTGVNAAARLAVGADYSILQQRAGSTLGAEWATSAHGWKLHKAAAVSIAAASELDVVMDTEDIDTDGYHTDSDAFVTIPAGLGGLYYIGTFGIWASAATVSRMRQIGFHTYGVGVVNPETRYTSSCDASHTISQVQSSIVFLAAGWKLSMCVMQDHTAAINLNTAYFWGVKIR